nr:MAG TPA: hypothetical protein [Caudoviricetes sp.]
MQLRASLTGNLAEILDKELKNAEIAVTRGISTATSQLKDAMRKQVKSARLGSRLAYTWRGDVYPKSKNSLKTVGIVYSKADKIMQSFEYGLVIKGKDGFWLAIPTPAIPKKIGGKKITPALYEKMKGIRLRYVYRPYSTSLLVHEQKRRTIIAFWLVPQVKMPKLINFETESRKIENKVPSLILANWRD